jgi:hypothetical protein
MTLLPGRPQRVEGSLLQLFDGSFRLAQRRGNLEHGPSLDETQLDDLPLDTWQTVHYFEQHRVPLEISILLGHVGWHIARLTD